MDLESLTPFLSSATRPFARSVPTGSKLLRRRNFLENPPFFRPQLFQRSNHDFLTPQTVHFQDADFPTRRHTDAKWKNRP